MHEYRNTVYSIYIILVSRSLQLQSTSFSFHEHVPVRSLHFMRSWENVHQLMYNNTLSRKISIKRWGLKRKTLSIHAEWKRNLFFQSSDSPYRDSLDSAAQQGELRTQGHRTWEWKLLHNKWCLSLLWSF
jgi:hypothetical protein